MNEHPTVVDDAERSIRMRRSEVLALLGARRTGSFGTPPPTGKAGSTAELQRLVAGVNPLLGAANVLLALVPQLRATTAHADPAGLQRQLLERVQAFEADAAASGVPRPQVVAARYVLCTFLDEVIASTPWGASGAWAERNLLQAFHDERWGGEKAFKLLERLGDDVRGNHDVLELFYVCLALGFEGGYRGTANGRAQLDAIAARLLQAVRPGQPAAPGGARTLSLRWTGVATRPSRALSALPLWVVFALGGTLVLATLLFLHARLDAQARPVFRQIHAVVASLRGADEPHAVPAAKPRVAPLLQADIASGALQVRDEPLRSVVTLPADAVFAGSAAELDPRRAELLVRVARALNGWPGQIAVVGHTDNVAQTSLQFPSNWHLSLARARAVLASLESNGVPAGRLRAEGRADIEPRSAEATPAARALNRRIEIELQLPRPDS
jgi:type VI secretion system protein ImpK